MCIPQLSCGRSCGPVDQDKHRGVVQAVQGLTDRAEEKWALAEAAAIFGNNKDEKEIWKEWRSFEKGHESVQ